ncbi:BAQ_1a_G0015390.mRNA.1.CDS.1 [Saccharomyces cerevisiae]|nr:BAM_G0012500.mRNA.1.CDS.1 [Saccharomyces cerevisiae]CAI4427728.1 BAQ_1a_G0015390.mRNA.1.CDS.1 [Saccharomyces cerevisiae]CAI7089480.1 BAM_G0012500.mRNA.1.CDS.1 [Saccharomyces cerevisiae]CAI7102185.1 BAQ_1a_G0015390.mRNA.1.CDS.1 [Saccharomyces cerevisiae]
MVRLSYLRLILPPCRLSELSSLAILYQSVIPILISTITFQHFFKRVHTPCNVYI